MKKKKKLKKDNQKIIKLQRQVKKNKKYILN